MSKWLINLNHSSAVFAVRHMMVSWVWGQFNRITGNLDFDPLDVAAGSVAVEIDAASIHTGVEKRDLHLKSPDFLDVEKYPDDLLQEHPGRAGRPGPRPWCTAI